MPFLTGIFKESLMERREITNLPKLHNRLSRYHKRMAEAGASERAGDPKLTVTKLLFVVPYGHHFGSLALKVKSELLPSAT